MKFDKVLVPVDGSPISDIATEIAINSAKMFGTSLTFLNVVDFSSNKEYGKISNVDLILQLQTEGLEAIDKVAVKAKEAGIPYDTKITEGVPWEVIVKLSKKYDQIIIGVTGKGNAGNGRIGENVKNIVEKSYCPVLTIKSGSRRLEDILLPVSNKNMAAINLAIETEKRTGGKITVLAVKDSIVDAESIAYEVAAHCKDSGVDATVKIADGDPARAIIAQSGMFDLIIMGTMTLGKGDVLHGVVTEDIILNAACPVTVVRDY